MLRYFKSNDGKVTLSAGNKKLDKTIAIFNLPAGKSYTCKQDCPGCYAKKAQYLYPQVLPCRITNWEISKKDSFVSAFCEALNKAIKAGCNVVRLHESGDIYNLDYCNKLGEIAALYPEIKFYYYTKTNYRVTGENVNCVNSFLPDGNLNYGDMDYCKVMAKLHNIPVCPVTMKVKKAKCGLTCTMCQVLPHMLFVIH